MARSRNIKPGFFKNEILAELPVETRMLFVGLWTLADREGRLEDRPKRIKMELFSYDSFDVDSMLNELAASDFLIRYEVDGKKFVQIENFVKHQDPHYREKASEIPAIPGREDEILATGVTRTQRARILERDNFTCQHCASKEHLCIDHILPVSRGGNSTDDNLQVLCLPCNTQKGNKLAGESRNIKSKSDRRSINQCGARPLIPDSLIPDSLIPDSLIPDSLNKEAKASSSPAALPDCPHNELIDLFAQKLPMLPQPKPELWGGARAKSLKARWVWVLTATNRKGERYATDKRDALDFFSRYFDYVAGSNFLTGRSGQWTGCDLAWLANETNFAKVMQGNYDNKDGS